MSDMTARWALPLLVAGQAHKEIYHNEALTIIDALLHGQVASADLTAPPADPMPGQCWIVADGGQGAWTGQDGNIACRTDGDWRFIVPRAGVKVHVADRSHAMTHDGGQWRDAALREDGLYIDGDRVIGPRREAITAPDGGNLIDAEARNAIGLILTALRNHGLIGG